MRKSFMVLCSIIAAIVGASATALAQQPSDQPDMAVDAATRGAVIEGTLKRLTESYVFPEVARKMEEAIRDRVQKKEYDQITSAKGLAQKLTTDLQAVSKDKHLRVRYSHEAIPAETADREPTSEERERFRAYLGSINFGFEKIERLKGNVGYIDLRGFTPAEFSAETIVAAMNFLANTDALIFDLRRNGGGDPATVALLSSYLFGSEPVHLNDLYSRTEDSTHQWWTLPYVPGKRYAGKDVYVLTSKRTFSAAEEFTYNLKNLKRATIIGETTGGGAHPGGTRRINEHFHVFVPDGRAINPISKTNWEGTGVKPDIDVPAEQALKTAHLAALKKLLDKATDPMRIDQLKRSIGDLEKETAEAKN
jgi:C-terminal processing protease CtpA/Prc